MDDCVERIQGIVDAGRKVNPEIMVICHGGPIAESADAEYVIKRADGIVDFFGASSIERFAAERGIKSQTEAFKKMKK
ncbi:putative TIM-barrel enzyme [Alicyclobacillus cycloheptanicus]|uniref:TIM-barrel enzyme n=1 Tax=Alicyclobacillus cycloheptanicus TaxID=1457 RepID=A0ABT9XMS1_9BACL|nr:putative TIM-barrel enzyme [Alicyclobacillus cycloheptanicus]